MASSKPINKMLYLTLDANFGEQQASIISNVVLYDNTTFKNIPHTIKECGNKRVIKIETEMSHWNLANLRHKESTK